MPVTEICCGESEEECGTKRECENGGAYLKSIREKRKRERERKREMRAMERGRGGGGVGVEVR